MMDTLQVVLVLGVATGVRSHLSLSWDYIPRGSVCVYRLQHELSVLQQQLCESRGVVHSLQCELQVYRGSPATFDPRELHIQLEQQLSGPPRSRRRLLSGQYVSEHRLN